MGITTDWSDASQQYCIIRIEAPWTWDQYEVLVDTAMGEINLVAHPVALIIDVTNANGFPSGDILGHLRYLETHIPSNVYASILVGGPYIITAFMNVFTQLRPNARRRVQFAKTIEEAQALARQQF
jgi:hypothetical protein